MKRITLEASRILPEPEADALVAGWLDASHYDLVIDDDTRVDRPDGSPLLVYRRHALADEDCRAAYHALRGAVKLTENRGEAGGIVPDDSGPIRGNEPIGHRTRITWRARKPDGTVSGTKRGHQVESGIAGFYDRNPRRPYCRATAFNLDHPERWLAAMPFIRGVDATFAAELPGRHAAQLARCRESSPDFVIHGTAFTTLTINRNWRTAAHRDKGDLREGFGCMAVLQAGRYAGGLLVWPRYRVAVDMRTRGVLLADVHELHGNTPLVGSGAWERIAAVLYYREGIAACGSSTQELARAKRQPLGKSGALHERIR